MGREEDVKGVALALPREVSSPLKKYKK